MVRARLLPEASVGRKWTHWEVEIEVPEDWSSDSTWGQRAPIPVFHMISRGKFKVGFRSLNDNGRRNSNGPR